MNRYLLAALLLTGSAGAVPLDQVKTGFAKNVIVMIPDGTSVDVATLVRWAFYDGKPLHIDPLASGMMRTHNSDTIIGDSAPAGTAMATGVKTQDKLIGIRPAAATLYGAVASSPDYAYAPVASVLEAAKLAGKSTGLVSTSEIQHATPADFSAHAVHRNMYTDIGEQQVYQNMNVVLGGGADYLLPDPKGSTDPRARQRIDGENMQAVIKENGYQWVTTRDELLKVTDGKVWGAFMPGALSKDFIRKSSEPTLREMTEKAINLLSKNDKGFFLMVEGSQVDWQAHANSLVGITTEYRAFDQAVEAALNFAKSNRDTLILIAADHGNGGISIGNRSTTSNYPEIPLEKFVTVLRTAKTTEDAALGLFNNERSNIAQVVKEQFGFDLSEAEQKAFQNARGTAADGKAFDNTGQVLVNVINERSLIGWTTGGHTGGDVPFYVYSADSANQLTGTIQNTDFAHYAAKALGVDLEQATAQLFVHQLEIEKLGHKITVDRTTPNVRITLTSPKGTTYTFFKNKNYFESAGQRVSFNGVVIDNDKFVFIPRVALDQIK